ncbi:vitamin B12 ABC transporter ATP-binding protein BtuD [Veronia pacifica]|uniref:Vitamin B12 ABC transporter ATP-binding protein BtuD n=1 Tax=Veronia pacifica TaxID=1080227 RepID=A0A1C3EEV8_9GAMM|nr:vitamin B12 ABC transporter ATP-binding protein BtuD [Veronia pacifica]ODA31775.1 vitamin B12 ABC transporter ATP-binding protein BtuD [Veronia pacifica]
MIRIEDLSLPPRLLPVNLTVNKGEILHILGPNGSGKSTLLSLLSGLEEGEGNIWIDGKRIAEFDNQHLAKVRGYLSQQGKPPFAIGVHQYLSLCLNAVTVTDSTIIDRVVKTLCDTLEINDKLSRNTEQLSGGEWQRVRLAGVCLQIWPELNPEAKVLILDEPASALDIAQQDVLYRLIKTVSDLGITIVMANHDLNKSLNEADRVVIMKSGHIIKQGLANKVMVPEVIRDVFGVEMRRHVVEGKSILL